MEANLNKAQPIWKRTWFRYLGVFIILQLLFIICEVTAWAPNFRPDGEFFNRVLNSQFFTEWFTPYKIPHFNMFTTFCDYIVTIRTNRCNERFHYKKNIKN